MRKDLILLIQICLFHFYIGIKYIGIKIFENCSKSSGKLNTSISSQIYLCIFAYLFFDGQNDTMFCS